ncbi:hypothetical protein CORC01_06260 [Colletotrichum orchidophilum]|uniref:Uncharacterized protein n=1 Tax=Colletotrichum orchidophilum TaxID=1209926 RepID=A0A1G4BAM3_9PEZI|nr:uncharacterized protein CORC01_06260 [Colletotrichum orchidophilum]OHE98469.1 hypothetical protein CORC01_06260 [Colletotrichum orchidophilum]
MVLSTPHAAPQARQTTAQKAIHFSSEGFVSEACADVWPKDGHAMGGEWMGFQGGVSSSESVFVDIDVQAYGGRRACAPTIVVGGNADRKGTSWHGGIAELLEYLVMVVVMEADARAESRRAHPDEDVVVGGLR